MHKAVTDAMQWGHDLYSQAAKALPSVLVGIFVFLVFILVAYLISAGIKRHARRIGRNEMVYKLLAKILRTGVILMGLISALGTMGVSISALVTSLGLVGFAMGFALKDILSSTLAGILLLIHRPFKVGDIIQVKGVEGQVVEIDLRFSILHDSGKLVMIPNSIMLKEVVIVQAGNDEHLTGEISA